MKALARRTLLAGAAVLPAAAPSVAATLDSPDAELIRLAEDFIAAEVERDRVSERFLDLPEPWSAEDRAVHASLSCQATRYHERLGAISMAEPTTPAGLIAQARAVMWHLKYANDDAIHGWNLGESVIRIFGQPIPDWGDSVEGE